MGFKQGWYKPKYPEKYIGNVHNIRYLSSWELKIHKFLDMNPNILAWSSEEIAIPYLKPTDKKIHKYYPDYFIKYKNRKGQIVQEIVEVKPVEQTRPSRRKNSKYRLYENMVYAINAAKFKAASKFCKKNGIGFRVVTQEHLFK